MNSKERRTYDRVQIELSLYNSAIIIPNIKEVDSIDYKNVMHNLYIANGLIPTAIILKNGVREVMYNDCHFMVNGAYLDSNWIEDLTDKEIEEFNTILELTDRNKIKRCYR